MPPFLHVMAQRAGPTALGFLVPPGRRSLVIVCPRSLTWDLLAMALEMPPTFKTFPRAEAVALARQLYQALEEAVQQHANPLAVIPEPAGQNFHVILQAAGHTWVLCQRDPGKPYQPALFPSTKEAQVVANQLAAILWPISKANQEYYFNTLNFFC